MHASTGVRTMADLIGIGSRTRDVLLVVGASLLTGLASQWEIRLPWTPVPITLQTFVVILLAASLGSRRAVAAMALYLLEGSMGLPFFSGGASGVAHLVGPTGGYLVGFVVAAAIIGALAERGWDRSPLRAAFAMLLGSLGLFACGLAQLATYIPREQLLAAGLTPFLLGSVLKVAAAAMLLPGLWRVLERSGLSHRPG
jgi:biotin transport system substrate-specific component